MTTEAAAIAGPAAREHSSGTLVSSSPLSLAPPVKNAREFRGSWVLCERGVTSFVAKARAAQESLARGLLVLQSEPDEKAWPYVMADSTGQGKDIIIPAVMLSKSDGAQLKEALAKQTATVAAQPPTLTLLTRGQQTSSVLTSSWLLWLPR